MLRTPLHDLHNELGAKMVPFAGYTMPVQYPRGILKEHIHTRRHAGLFDVSHMGQIVVSGVDAARALESVIPTDFDDLQVGQLRYGLLTHSDGGIIDDLIITRWSETEFFLVVNAACKQEDVEYLRQTLGSQNKIQELDRSLVAIQGPDAHKLLANLDASISNLPFMSSTEINLYEEKYFVSRSGYTGEDGFEISVPSDKAEGFVKSLLAEENLIAVGLGARDSLRLEAGLCLYGHDITLQTSPVEAGLIWTISKSRRTGGNKAGGFPGSNVILKQIEDGVDRKRVGFKVKGRIPVREGAKVSVDNREVGQITSGGFSPCLELPIAMGYVLSDYAAAGTELIAEVRGKLVAIEVSAMPFVLHQYYKPA